jgi:O-antigen/teichoic acid export membrane protein
LSRNTAASIFGRLLYVVTRVGLPPLILHFVSVEAYGIWATCFVLISYIGMGAFGVSNVYIRYVAEYNAKHQTENIGQLLSAGLLLTLGFIAVTMVALWLGMPLVMAWFKIPAELQGTARVLILGTVATMLLDLTFGAFAYVLGGLQRIALSTYVWILSYLLEVVLIVAFLLSGWGVVSLMWAFVARYVFSTVVYVVLCFRAIPGLRLTLRGLRASNFRPFLGYGGTLQVIGLISVFLYSVEKILAGRFAGIGSVAILDVGQKFPMMTSQVFAAFTSSYLPAVTHLHSLGKDEELRRLYVQATRSMNVLNGLAMGFMAAFAGLIMTVWIGERSDVQDTVPILLAATIGFQLHELTGPASSYFQGIHRPARLFEYLTLQLVGIGIGLALVVRYVGYDVVAIAELVAASRVVGSLIYLTRANRSIGIRNRRFFREVLLPGFVPYAWGFALFSVSDPWLEPLAGQRLWLLGALAAAGILYVIWSAGYLWLFQLAPDERQAIAGMITRRRRQVTASA